MHLFQRASYQRNFESEILEVRPEAWVRLSETLFYPTSGGQPHDTGHLRGHLGGAEVTEVKLEGGEVWHLLQGVVPGVGASVSGEIDWARRYRHMQRHTAQHMLSQAFLRLNPSFETRSVSLSGPVCTVDLTGEPRARDLEAAERVVSEVVYQGLEIRAFEVDEGELHLYPLRRPPKVSGRIRLVQMGDWELSACGGTHLRTTSEAGPIKLLRSERVKGGLTRISFCAGWESLEDYGRKHHVVLELALEFSAQVADVGARVKSVQEEAAVLRRCLGAQGERLSRLLARELLERASGGVVAHVLVPEDAELLKPLAHALTQRGVTALLAAPREGRVQLLFARGPEVRADMHELLEMVLPYVEGRGGGKPDLAQGSGRELAGTEAALQAAVRRLCS